MLPKLLKVGLSLLFLGLCLGAYVQLRKANAQLRPQIAAARARTGQTVRLRADNQRLQAMVEQAKTDEDDALHAIHGGAEQARTEVEELEQRAGERRAAKLAKDRATAAALANNRDLTKGPVLIENCANVGRATPVDAIQTLVWAGVKGNDELVASMIVLDRKARAVVAALLSSLPDAVREKYPTPEKLAALVWADSLLNVSALQVVGQSPVDPQHVTLTIGRLSGKTVDVSMELATDGWQVATADRKLFDSFKAKILGPNPAAVEAKK